jgi:hypothetical protein
MDLKETSILGDAIAKHWYYQSKAQALLRLVQGERPAALLDVGSGSAFFAKQVLAGTDCREAWCVDTSYPRDSDGTVDAKPIHFRRSITGCPADLVLLMDVLEHVDDDTALLSHYVDMAPRGATFVISVPAFQFMWSGHDEFLGHKRRYTLGQIESVVSQAGLTPRRGTYYFGFALPIAYATRRLGAALGQSREPRTQLRAHGPTMNRLLSGLCRMEMPLLSMNRLGGLTAFCVASKP